MLFHVWYLILDFYEEKTEMNTAACAGELSTGGDKTYNGIVNQTRINEQWVSESD